MALKIPKKLQLQKEQREARSGLALPQTLMLRLELLEIFKSLYGNITATMWLWEVITCPACYWLQELGATPSVFIETESWLGNKAA